MDVLERMTGSAANGVSATAAAAGGAFDACFVVLFVSQQDLRGGAASLG